MVIKKISSLSFCFLLVFFSKASFSMVFSWTMLAVLLGAGAHREVKYNAGRHPYAAPALAFVEGGAGLAAQGAYYLTKGAYATAQYTATSFKALYNGAEATALYLQNKQNAKGYSARDTSGGEHAVLEPLKNDPDPEPTNETNVTGFWRMVVPAKPPHAGIPGMNPAHSTY